jgi:YHYH protein
MIPIQKTQTNKNSVRNIILISSLVVVIILAGVFGYLILNNQIFAKKGTDISNGIKIASWGKNVTMNYTDGYLEFKSDGLPNHARAAKYAVPKNNNMGGGNVVPTADTAMIASDPTKSQSYDFQITTRPTKANKTTSTSLGTIGVMISGAALFNPYEGDGKTVATASNFFLKDTDGSYIAFLDTCNGHPNPMGAYHYHGLPTCITTQVDKNDGPSHIIGVAFDGFPIYGDQDMNGKKIKSEQLDTCNGITSATPEFPEGIYHYVLLNTTDATSSIKCFSGNVETSLIQKLQNLMGGM